uniref:CHK kinase-like domain-containing protein n=1 Tax=Anopheles coluzzii TaxID=1518534 RepID=A0A8W7PPW8_ANOCL
MDTQRVALKLSDISPKFTEETLDEIVRCAGGKRCTGWKIPETNFTKGDAYLSELYRIQLTGEPAEPGRDEPLVVNVVVKTIPKNVGRRNTFRSADFFRNEANFYNVVLKELYRFQDARKPANPFKDINPCYVAYTDGVNDFVAMEDLGQYGYKTASRAEGVGLEECKRCMRSLGRFHALSLAMKEQEPDRFHEIAQQHVEETYYSARLKSWYNNFLQVQIDIARDAMAREYPGTELERTMEKFFDCDLYDHMVYLTHTRNQNSVINHGDCWMPNFLFHDSTPAMRMIDFQLARYCSPALDIAFFVYSCTSQALRDAHYEDLLGAYHGGLAEMLRDLGSDPDTVFPRAELEKEMRQYARFGCGMGIESIPFSLLDESEVPDLDKITGEQAVPIEQLWILRPIASQAGRRRLTDIDKGVELADCLRCICSMARFHALSFAMKQQDPEAFERIVSQLEETYYSAALESWHGPFMQRIVTICKEALEIECTESPDRYTANFRRDAQAFLNSPIYGMMVELANTRNRYAVITHGDCWLPNFLLRPDQVRMIDFQMVRCASPVLDLVLFVYCCTDQALRDTHYDQLLSAYYHAFAELLAELGTDPQATFPSSVLAAELQQFGRFGCGIAVESIPLAQLDESDVPDLDRLEGTEPVPLDQILTVRSIGTQYGRRRLVDVLRHAYDRGYL